MCLAAAVSLPFQSSPLSAAATVAALQDEAQMALSRHVDAAYPAQPSRFGKLLLLLPLLRSVPPSAVEDLFFRSTLGPVPVSLIVANMFAASDL